MQINERLFVPDHEFQFDFARSGGPGGQNVNKVNSKAVLTWDFANNTTLPNDVKERFRSKFGNKLTKEELLVIAADEYRDQKRNVAACEEKLKEMILSIAVPPKKRRPTKPTRASKEKRLDQKKSRSDVKKNRGRVDY